MSRYPTIWYGNTKKGRRPVDESCECAACQKPATVYVGVKWSYMSDDKDWVPACERHSQMYGKEFTRFIAHVRTKERFLERGK